MFGGEALEPPRLVDVAGAHPGSPRMINMYGITETTVHASFREIVAGDVGSAVSPIGAPLAGSGVLRAGRLVAAGAARVWSVSCMWPVRGWRVAMWAGRG